MKDKELTPEHLLVSQHVSWISVDPIYGCPASCAYCYLLPLSLTRRKPTNLLKLAPRQIYKQLQDFKYLDKSIFSCKLPLEFQPIAFGNYTDMCMTPKNKEFLYQLLQEHERVKPETPACILTKAKLDDQFLQRLSQLKIQLLFFISLSFLSSEFEQGTPPVEARLQNFKLIAQYENMKAIHWWRPITSINVPDRKAVERQLDLLQLHEAQVSIIIGLAYGSKLSSDLEADDNPLQQYFLAHRRENRELIFENWIQKEILGAARGRGYPVFTGTACAISYVLEKPCYRAGFRKPFYEQSCLSSNCSAKQKKRCQKYAQANSYPSQLLLRELADYLNMAPEKIRYSDEEEVIIVEANLPQEELNFLTQATNFAVTSTTVTNNLEWQTSLSKQLRPRGM